MCLLSKIFQSKICNSKLEHPNSRVRRSRSTRSCHQDHHHGKFYAIYTKKLYVSSVGTPTNGGRSTPSGRKTPNIRNVSLNKSLEKRMNNSKTITISPYPKKPGANDERTKSPKKKLPPVRQTKVRQMTETEVEKLKTKWNGKYNQEIGQNMETLEVKMTKEKIKSPVVKK